MVEKNKQEIHKEILSSCRADLHRIERDLEMLIVKQEVSVEPYRLIKFCKSLLGSTPDQIEQQVEELRIDQKYPDDVRCEIVVDVEEDDDYIRGELYLRDIYVELTFDTLKTQETITAENAPDIINRRKMKFEALQKGDMETYCKLQAEEPDCPARFICSRALVTFQHGYEFRNAQQTVEKTCLPILEVRPMNFIEKIQNSIRQFFINRYSLARYSRWESGNIKIHIADQPQCICYKRYICFAFKE